MNNIIDITIPACSSLIVICGSYALLLLVTAHNFIHFFNELLEVLIQEVALLPFSLQLLQPGCVLANLPIGGQFGDKFPAKLLIRMRFDEFFALIAPLLVGGGDHLLLLLECPREDIQLFGKVVVLFL